MLCLQYITYTLSWGSSRQLEDFTNAIYIVQGILDDENLEHTDSLLSSAAVVIDVIVGTFHRWDLGCV